MRCPSFRDRWSTGRRRNQQACATSFPRTGGARYDVHRAVEVIADSDSSLEARPRFGRGMSPPSRGSRATRSGSVATIRCISPVRSPATAPTRPHAFCNCARRSACRSSSSVTRPGSWSDRRRGHRTGPACEPVVPRRRRAHGSLHDRGVAQGITASARRHGGWKLPRAVDDRRMAHRRIRRDGARGCGEARPTGRSWRRSRTPRRGGNALTPWSRTRTNGGPRSTPQRISRLMTSSTRRKPGIGGGGDPQSWRVS